jgi:hypothetical protein
MAAKKPAAPPPTIAICIIKIERKMASYELTG